jgi:hypothetical protein
MKQILFPTLEDLRAEHVLVQAWKKTATYLRQHSWYADTLELDYQSLRLPDFIRELQARLRTPEHWTAAPLDIVPAPKSQAWDYDGKAWKPKKLPHKKEPLQKKIRPLAHVALPDQVLATAMLMCLADQVELRMGDPLLSINSAENRKQVLAYGHRLFCDSTNNILRHRWGSSKLYRLYYRDYQTFLRRPEVVKDQLLEASPAGYEVAIVQSDLSKFYDRVRPTLLHQKVSTIPGANDSAFFHLFQKVFAWRWRDEQRARDYGKLQGIEAFETVALPQGLVASGFFANAALLDFGSALQNTFNHPIDVSKDYILKDACYYVDDLRLVLLVKRGAKEAEVQQSVTKWLQQLLDKDAPGLIVEDSKTKVTVSGRKERFLVQQSKTAKRIQRDVSGVFDMHTGTELIGAIEGFFHTQKQYSSQTGDRLPAATGLIVGISDMRDDTAARFAAGKYRRTFRSLRPLLEDEPSLTVSADRNTIELSDPRPANLALSKQQLDERGQLFSATLIEEWVKDPGNVRLLRIGLDLYPDVRFLRKILKLLRPGWRDITLDDAEREVRLYCLAEIFRAGATETGMVSDQDCLPSDVSLPKYHACLRKEAAAILEASLASHAVQKCFPWYLLQQLFLYLAAQKHFPEHTNLRAHPKSRKLELHQRFATFISGQGSAKLTLKERAMFLILAHSAFGHEEVLERAAINQVSPQFLHAITEISPGTARALWIQMKSSASSASLRTARSLGLEPPNTSTQMQSLAEWAARVSNPFWQEDNLLHLALGLLKESRKRSPRILTPWQVYCKVSDLKALNFGKLAPRSVRIRKGTPKGIHVFSIPEWCESGEDKRRFQLGMLLRFALRGSVDFYSSIPKQLRRKLPRYRLPVSHWEKQRYATFQGRSAFGPPWIPISSWVENFLFDLLRWPGSGLSSRVRDLSEWASLLEGRVATLEKLHGPAAQLCFLEQTASWPKAPPKEWSRPLRLGIVQSVIPNMEDYERHKSDPELHADPTFRAKQRRHLASVMEAVDQMLKLRDTHQPQLRFDGCAVDLLIFPELAIHPLDIDTLILPFVRTHKCMALFGQVYHRASSSPGAPLINSCLWMIPEWTTTAGFQIKLVEQGKAHLTTPETLFTPPPSSFRPAQWIIEYQWHSSSAYRPLKLSASICYDATDLALASDLKSRNDVYIVCALNQDVGTFDRMSEGLHYHMYQGVIVVNNGQFGGSSFYMPFGESFHRQVFHLHGQPQASIAFAEITPEKLINRPDQDKATPPVGEWKTPPANWSTPGNSFTL